MKKGQKMSKESRLKMSLSHLGNKVNLGRVPSIETRKKMSLSHMGNTNAKGYKHSLETRAKVSVAGKGKIRSVETRKKMSLAQIGNIKGSINQKEKHWNWKGGISPINKQIRKSLEYKQWRSSVFKRDNHTCVLCFIKTRYIEADHIKGFAQYPKLRFVVSNGRTLCKPCHRKTHNYGRKLSTLPLL